VIADSATPILFFDGTCGFCARALQFVLRHEGKDRSLRFARLEGPLGTTLRARIPELVSVDSLIWYESATASTAERLLWQARGVLRVARYLGGFWRVLGTLGSLIPRPLLDAGYAWIARHRHQLAAESCLVPTPEQRARFVDL
jgi:predicted DCC family thiol-disulfide oxidoreductase YuxK